ncbi:MAG TPA: BatA domain-containing protein [Gemmatimonadaceae bacterium]|nr:BatA domain-containing protein [Gemmatimonadaceae bacterium]
MSFLAPGFLVAAVVGALGVVALHFIVTRRPRALAFPTARFVPDVPVAARARSIQLSDLLLLAVRVLMILLAGGALARPIFPPQRERVVRVIAADVSGSVENVAETRDSVRALFRPGDAVVQFDTAARLVESPDSIGVRSGVTTHGSLSVGLIGALRAGSRVRNGADSVELVVVSPATLAERDRATAGIRAQWPGRGRLVRVAAKAAADNRVSQATQVEFLSVSRPRLAIPRNRIDTVGAVVADGHVVVAPFERRWRFVSDSLAHARVIARWVDGEAAAIEWDSASTCTRSVAVPIDNSGDMPLRPSFVDFRVALAKSCARAVSGPDPDAATMLASAGHLAAATHFPPSKDVDSPLARWLAAIAIALAIVDMILRRPRNVESEQ